jgi:hypothetical protein
MKMPGFTAETSLRTNLTACAHTSASLPDAQTYNGNVIPSLQRVSTTGCGTCSELKWPNGTGTGACVQDCCDVLGNCQIKACPCGSGAGSVARSFGLGSSLTRRSG